MLDMNTTYVRETREIVDFLTYNKDSLTDFYRVGDDKRNAGFYFKYLGYCGQIYTICSITKSFNENSFDENKLGNIFTNVDEVNQHIDEYLPAEVVNEYLRSKKNIGYSTWFGLNHVTLRGVFDKYEAEKHKYMKLFAEHRVPLFTVDFKRTVFKSMKTSYTITLNPNLSGLSFFKIKDSRQCFQDIYQYMSGVLGNSDKEIPAVSDIDMVVAKGFDKRYSFRKDKSNDKT